MLCKLDPSLRLPAEGAKIDIQKRWCVSVGSCREAAQVTNAMSWDTSLKSAGHISVGRNSSHATAFNVREEGDTNACYAICALSWNDLFILISLINANPLKGTRPTVARENDNRTGHLGNRRQKAFLTNTSSQISEQGADNEAKDGWKTGTENFPHVFRK